MRCFRMLLVVLLATFSLAGLLECAALRAQEPAVMYVKGALAVSLPYHGQQGGTGTLTLEILDPEDHVLGRSEARVQVSAAGGVWQQTVTPDHAISFADIAWERLRYAFRYADAGRGTIEGTEAIASILRRPVVRVLGQSEYMSGSKAAVRIIVSDTVGNPISSGAVRVELERPKQASIKLFSGKLDGRGTVEAQLRLPANVMGGATLHFVAETAMGTAEYSQHIQLLEKASILLTTEKPIYQPGQTIHVRALALDRAGHMASANRALTFEVEDSKGNKVFRRATSTDKFGIASATFTLADEVNLGAYHVRAKMGDAAGAGSGSASNSGSAAEIAVNVQRYVLPKFKVAIEFAMKDGKQKRDFRPGDVVTGTVRADYFFGQPVPHAAIDVKASGADVAVFEAASVHGTTDADGVFHFELQLPKYFAGQALTQGAARALVEASVKDAAEHTETRGEPITVSQSALLINAVPEGGTLAPNLDNEVFVLTSYPDGTPAPASVTVRLPDARVERVTTDETGVAMVKLHAPQGRVMLKVEADDHHGSRAESDVTLDARAGADQVLLRTNHAIYKAGDRIQLRVLSTRSSGSAYVDIVKSGQTILTRDVDLQNGEAELTLTATPEMAGALDIDAYIFGRDAQPVADHRLVFVQPADELHIETTADAGEYKPGGEANVRFHVTNAHGEGVSAALGVEVVDEAVFALAEKQPGFAKTFFYLEQEVMKPRYEIHSIEMPAVINSGEAVHERGNELAARALFSATEMANPTRVDVEFGRELPAEHRAEFEARYQEALVGNVRELVAEPALNGKRSKKDFVDAFNGARMADGKAPQDAWGSPLRINPAEWQEHSGARTYVIRSAGPDRKFDTDDDLVVYIHQTFGAGRRGTVASHANGGGFGIELDMEEDRGPANGRAEVTGSVMDQTGASIPDATVTLRQIPSDAVRVGHSNGRGEFTLNALTPAKYRVTVTAPGFVSATKEFTVDARERAVLRVTLSVGSVTTTVQVDNGAVDGLEVMDAAAMQAEVRAARPLPAPMMLMAAPASGIAGGMGMGFAAKRNKVATLALVGRAVDDEAGNAAAETHVRSYFPEALYINPEVLTDGQGNASISIPIADSITTWRMAMLASTQSGALGSGTGSLKVFQDFFVDMDLPLTLTQGDRVSIPVAIFNYSGKAGRVSLKLQPDAWYTLENDVAEKSVAVESSQPGAASFTVNASRIGKFKLTLTAHMDGVDAGHDDVLVREIEVVPNGREKDVVFNGRLEHTVSHEIQFPAQAIPEASSVLVRLYPGPLSQVIEGMDSILRMPSGCFEQTSSSTYPNVLALDYMKRTGKLAPEVHAKAEGFIANGYQRLLTFEVPGGGFSWFGQAPANKILTAYGLMEFHDMAQVSDVDPRLIVRTADWLARQQQPDGSWKPDTQFINEGATNRFNTGALRITAYIAWALAATGYQGPAVEHAKQFIEAHEQEKADAYTLAVIANFAADMKGDPEFERRAMQALLDAKVEKDDQVSWTAQETGVYSTGASATIETTGLATQALLKWGQAPETARKALAFIASKKEASGNWGTTQATIMALKSLVLASEASAADTHGTLRVTIDGKVAETLELNGDNNDLLHQFVFKRADASAPASVQLSFEGSGGMAYQVVGRYFVPWENKAEVEPMSISVAYDRTTLAQNDIATATATVHNNLPGVAKMVMVDLGIPPGFDLLSEDLQAMQEKTAAAGSGRLEKFSLTATQAILYFNALAPGQTVTIPFRLRAKYPIRTRTFESRVYEYYDPAVAATARPVAMTVTGAR